MQLYPKDFPQGDPKPVEGSPEDWRGRGGGYSGGSQSCPPLLQRSMGHKTGSDPHSKFARDVTERKSGDCILLWFATDIVLIVFSFLKFHLAFYGNHYPSCKIKL